MRRKRAAPGENWKDTPFTIKLRQEMERQRLTGADVMRMLGSQSSVMSRWMAGNRPDTESLVMLAEALGLDPVELMVLTNHLPASALARDDTPPRLRGIIAKLKAIDWTEDRYEGVESVVEGFWRNSQRQAHDQGEEEGDPPLRNVGG